MDALNEIMPIVLYFLGAILLVVVIVLITRLITTVDKVNVILDDLEGKSQSLNGLFDAIEKLTETIANANNKVTSFVAGVASNLFDKRKKKKKKKVIEEENIENE